MLGLWLLLYPLFHIHGIPMSQRLAMLQPSLSFRFRFRGVRKGLPAAGAAWQRKPGENHEGSGGNVQFHWCKWRIFDWKSMGTSWKIP